MSSLHMDPAIIAAIITGVALLANTIVTVLLANASKKLKQSVDQSSNELSKKFDESTQIVFIDGEKASFDALTRLTLSEPVRIRVTRFNPRKIERQKRYFSSVYSRITGSDFDGENCSKLEKYNRLTSINSDENKNSLISQINSFLEAKCDNLVLRVTADKNDFEVLIFEGSEVAAFCFHDLGTQNVVHSCVITRDKQVFQKFRDLYEKLWNEDILLEIDFSMGEEHVRKMLHKLEQINPINNKERGLSPIDNMVREAKLRMEACDVVSKP